MNLKALEGRFDVRNAEREMILNAALPLIGSGRNVEHVLDPIGTVGNLKLFPIHIIVLESAVPVHAETKQVAVETIFDGVIFDNKAGVKDAIADLVASGRKKVVGLLDKRDGMALGIEKFEMLESVAVFGDWFGGDAVRQEIATHLCDVGGSERDGSQQIVRGTARNLRQLDLLMRIYCEAWTSDTEASSAAAGQAENLAVELARSVE